MFHQQSHADIDDDEDGEDGGRRSKPLDVSSLTSPGSSQSSPRPHTPLSPTSRGGMVSPSLSPRPSTPALSVGEPHNPLDHPPSLILKRGLEDRKDERDEEGAGGYSERVDSERQGDERSEEKDRESPTMTFKLGLLKTEE